MLMLDINTYHRQASGMVKSFNQILEMRFTKVFPKNRDDLDERVHAVL